MPLGEFAGVFSRYFVVGFFLPLFFALAALSQVVDEGTLPSGYREQSGGTQILIIGGVALLGGLLLSGVHYVVLRLFEGYPLSQARNRRLFGGVHAAATRRWEREFDELQAALAGPRSPERTRAAMKAQNSFPPKKSELLPTRFGNAIRAFERHSNVRYGLDGVAVWPRIASLLSEQELNELADRRTDVAFFVNGALVAGATAGIALIDSLVHWIRVPELLSAVAAAMLALLLYLAAVNAAKRWGTAVRSAIDMHRLELYSRLGVRLPDRNEEELRTARSLSRLLLYAEPIPDADRLVSKEDEEGNR